MAFSDNNELWNSSEDYDGEQDEYEPPAEDATFFAFDLKPEGDPGGYHVRNKPGEKQRRLASRISSGPRKRPAYDVNATARAIIHGTVDDVSQEPATLLVYDVHFFARRPRRIKAATISFEFKPQIGAKKLGPTVSQMAPFGEHSIWHSTEMVTKTIGGDAGISGGVGATVGANLSSEKSTEKTVTYAAHIIGHNPPNDWGDCLWAQWSLEENRSQKGGVVRIFRACILLTRDVGDEEFLLFPTLRVTPDTNSQIRDLVSFRREDEAIIMVPSSDPVNDLNVDLAKEKRNLGIPNMHMMEEYPENDELDLVQSTEGLPSPTFEHPDSMDTQEKSWRNLSLEEQCTDVLGLLSRNQRQWSADVTSGIPALELYKKNALREGIDSLDRTAPTALHILAKRPQDFQKVPSSTQEQMMRSLLDFREQNLLEMRKDRVESQPLFLELAIAYDNSDFITCVEHCMEHINLYWSGSQAVLRGWDSDEGIPRLATRGKLKSVTVHATPHDWVETMDKFRAALISLPDIKTDLVKRVKVALVDDGINLGNLHMYNGNVKVTGLSFFPREYGSENPWHCSNTGHGTILANMIVRVNPRVHLCVLRVHDVATRDGSRNIFARSAARAIKSAVEQDVDVICMSWTIKTRIERSTAQLRGDGREISTADKEKPELTDMQRLEKAIDAAKEAGILMFCSASDDIMASAMDTLPYRKQPDYIFRIGAAQSLGQQDPHSEDVKRIDYFFPGHQVAEARNPRSNQAVEYHDGSLAHYSYEKRKARGVSGRNPYEGLDRALREQASMKMALDNIKKNHSPGHEKFLPVWNVFS
ncbi:hypothetical protein CTRI78_v010394 [Colletotrichum trifolii]|uniref:Peptidase S8/S53 domain-containing protein n=1 Tax=Colletotrichum trifolii TaxID=5466 RepID=A0A4R8QM45_COLTR|nr:hypothetical protein CTRI78_v010394 [Colletotrichum trifolii]